MTDTSRTAGGDGDPLRSGGGEDEADQDPVATPTPTPPEDEPPTEEDNGNGQGNANGGDSAPAGVAVPSSGKTAHDDTWNLAQLRDIATILFAAAILGVGLYILWQTFAEIPAAGASDTAFEQRKDVLLITLGLMGTVTGYFFGRVPAENRARQAEQQVGATTEVAKTNAENLNQSETERTKLQGKVDDSKKTVGKLIHSGLGSGAAPAAAPTATERTLSAHTPQGETIDLDVTDFRARVELEALQERLDR